MASLDFSLRKTSELTEASLGALTKTVLDLVQDSGFRLVSLVANGLPEIAVVIKDLDSTEGAPIIDWDSAVAFRTALGNAIQAYDAVIERYNLQT